MSAIPPPQDGASNGGADPPDRDGDKGRRRDRAADPGATGARSKDAKPREENPSFSFRQFLAQPHGGSGDASNIRNTGARPKTRPRMPTQQSPHHSRQPEPDPEMSRNYQGSGLPDFLRDYMSPASPLQPEYPAGQSLPFDLTRENPPNAEHQEQQAPSEEDAAYPSLSLPDFLSDGVLANAEPTSSSSSDVIAIAANAPEAVDPPNNVEALRAEVASLRIALDRERERSRVLEIRLERTRREGNHLEEAELRLAEAISRAEHAEKALRDCETSRLKLENQIIRQSNASGSGPNNLVLMRVRRAAAQISLAAEVAETSLGQLLSGVESLKSVADELRELIADDDDGQNLKGACGKSV